ncbi:recombinase RecT [Prescottella equi]|uniref:Rect-like protein n=1 Tax=Rhodococcus phage REQ3 TaxID=1109714 RepID=G9FH58_9CAUD|nr:recombinase RecT [Prescottella equi]YP_005087203.1 RecT-like ssDNA annealing protein [Rhodococcus phage REQ3]AEV51947.1 Rect-like protein [Rhodococcus phage REQ3]ERN43277.1 hypothetical protein H849_24449 [Prescottella equi NBRC 101255 = C 7]ORL29041.1 hypothetical protein A6I89_01790 [Prescottella equi]QPQ77293.1 recombinase RecT [Prescottella equi]SUE04853.1 Uncharacterised protein [Prescottella equi]
MTTTEIELRQQDSLAEKIEWSKAMATGDMLPRQYRGNPANLMFACEYADALGIPRINALTSIHVIDGKPTASADLIASLVRKAGHRLRVEGDDTYAEVTIIRADDPDYIPTPVRWDEAKARKAGKWGTKGPWTNYPGAMLRSRAITEAARMWASDALFGVIYTAEELGGAIDEEGRPAPAPRQQQRSQRPTSISEALAPEPEPVVVDMESLMDAAARLDTYEALLALWDANVANLTEEQAEELKAFMKARKAQLAAESESEPEPADEPTLDDAIDAEVVA